MAEPEDPNDIMVRWCAEYVARKEKEKKERAINGYKRELAQERQARKPRVRNHDE